MLYKLPCLNDDDLYAPLVFRVNVIGHYGVYSMYSNNVPILHESDVLWPRGCCKHHDKLHGFLVLALSCWWLYLRHLYQQILYLSHLWLRRSSGTNYISRLSYIHISTQEPIVGILKVVIKTKFYILCRLLHWWQFKRILNPCIPAIAERQIVWS